ncbi:glucuronate isomerase [Chishuiella changwenlii]|uniref:Uronate isomerase n=1 Tax=Chishuiella changwenlii TaxID=1434701 RepID=A0A1M6UXV5_9FLAO|nr:glucuronate isomerase [Chishuiella changwenlii]GGF02421.1 uronate isomerase [Chishuiella changwenlii]SHK73984.1 glucuronate isomerase [Chishuiella changwenlii]
MNSTFLKENFILESPIAEKLYFDYAAKQPIIDYHSHLSPKVLAENENFENITALWLQGDHYKWRAMRAFGIEEEYITGSADDKEKFRKWAEVVPYTVRNPLFHWTHMELQNPFGITELLSPKTADKIYEQSSELLALESFKPQALLQHFNVEMQGTTDDPTDSLEYHQALRKQNFKVKVLPSFRPDKVFAIHTGEQFRNYINRLALVSDVTINSFESLVAALKNRIDFFHSLGCVSSDHSFSSMPIPEQYSKQQVENILVEVLNGNDERAEAISNSFAFYLLTELCCFYNEKDWVQQFHLGALRNANNHSVQKLGADTGFDSIGDENQAKQLSTFLNHLESKDQLAKTVIYNLNPAYNTVFAAMVGNFNAAGIKGKIQFGSAWWFLDQLDGMTKQINELSNLGLISTFIGMLTDSRSFVSYSRHEYFRRLICNLFAEDMNKGYIPNDVEFIGSLIEGIAYKNAHNYFNL